MRSLPSFRPLRAGLALSLFAWSAAPAAAEEPAATCLHELREFAVPHAEMTVTRLDGTSFAGRLARLDAGDGRLRLRTFDPAASRFSTMEFDEREILGLTYRRDTTSSWETLFYVSGLMAGGLALGLEIGQLANEETTPGEVEIGTAALGVLGVLAGMVAGLILAPKSSDTVTLDCRSAAP